MARGRPVTVSFSADVSQFISGLGQADSALGRFSRSVSSMERDANNVIAPLTSVNDALLKVGAAAVTAAAGAAAIVAGFSLNAGWNRLVGIDNAEKKLSALNVSSTDTKVILDTAMESVKGTSYAFDQAANAAAGFIASGTSMENLDTVMRGLVGTSSVFGADLDQTAAIFRKVESAGRAYTMELNQLDAIGVPIWKLLGEATGQTAEETRKMAAEGKITADLLRTTLFDAYGEAGTSAATFSGAIGGVRTALARLGADFIEGALGEGSVQSVIDRLAKLTEKVDAAQPYVKMLGETAGFMGQQFLPGLRNLADAAKAFAENISGSEIGSFGDLLSAAADSSIKLGDSFTRWTQDVKSWAGSPEAKKSWQDLLGLMGELAGFVEDNGPLVESYLKAWMEFAVVTLPLLTDALESANSFLSGFDTDDQRMIGRILVWTTASVALVGTLARVASWVSSVGRLFGGLVSAVRTPIGAVVRLAGSIPTAFSNGFARVTTVLLNLDALWGRVFGGFSRVLGPLSLVVDGIANTVDKLGFLKENVEGTVEAILNGDWSGAAMSIVEGIIGVLTMPFPWFDSSWAVNIGSVLREGFGLEGGKTAGELVSGLLKGWSDNAKAVWDGAKSVGQWIIDAVKDVLGIRSPSTVFASIGRDTIAGLLSGLAAKGSEVGAWATRFGGWVIGTFSGAGSWLWTAGRNVLDGFLSGFNSKAREVLDRVWNMGREIANAAKNALGIASPSRVFRGIGNDTGAGFWLGWEDSMAGGLSAVKASMSDVARNAVDGANFSGFNSAGPAKAGNVYNITVQTLVPTADTGRIITQAIKDYERRGA